MVETAQVRKLEIEQGKGQEWGSFFINGLSIQLNLKHKIIFFPTFLFIDIDECIEGTEDCDVNAVCTDTYGSFTCTCKAGFEGDGETCTSK